MPQDRIIQIFIRLILRLVGLCLVGFSFAYTLALLSFNSDDSSFNTVSTDDHINNWMGAFGSHISDLSFQLIGLSSFILCLIIFSIGTKMSNRFGIRNLLPKIILTPFCILCLSVFFASLPQPSWWEFDSFGGVNGRFILAKIPHLPMALTSGLALFFSVILTSIIIEISIGDWIYLNKFGEFYFQPRYLGFKEGFIDFLTKKNIFFYVV